MPGGSPTWFKAAAWEDKTRYRMSGVFGIEMGNFNGRVVVVKFKKTFWQVGQPTTTSHSKGTCACGSGLRSGMQLGEM
jgi:hypothetical protein